MSLLHYKIIVIVSTRSATISSVSQKNNKPRCAREIVTLFTIVSQLMEAERTSETLVYFNETTRCSDGYNLYTRSRDMESL
jgi:hypothetical protein